MGVAVAVAGAILLAGCSSMPVAESRAVDRVDHQKMQAVEGVAYVRGIRVMWVNLPEKVEK